jgi:hypothetical protein
MRGVHRSASVARTFCGPWYAEICWRLGAGIDSYLFYAALNSGLAHLRGQQGSKTLSFYGHFGGLIRVRAIESMGLRV